MKKYIYIILVFIFLIINQKKTYAHGETLFGSYAFTTMSYDLFNNVPKFGLEYNAYAVFLNTSIQYEYGNYEFGNANVGNIFIGLGFLNFIQLQIGYSSNKYFSLKLKSELAMDDIFISPNEYIRKISVSINIEKALVVNEYNYFVSFGIGYRFSN